MDHWKRTFLHSIIAFFALIGLGVFVLFVAHGLGATNVSGIVTEATTLEQNDSSLPNEVLLDERTTLCLIDVIGEADGSSAREIEEFLKNTGDWKTGGKMVRYALAHIKEESVLAKAASCTPYHTKNQFEAKTNLYPWKDSKEWNVLRISFGRDKDSINNIAKRVGISPRLIIGPVMGEQLRFFTSARASFEQYFEPVKQFIHLSKFSYGVAGMKPETAEFIENTLKDPSSMFYLGPEYEHMLDYAPGQDPAIERMNRISNQADHTYSYLYVALGQKMLITQWQRAGFDISEQPGVLATLYNLGFYRSKPHDAPGIGGAPITIDGTTYSFGQLAEEFYWSGELSEDFPFSAN